MPGITVLAVVGALGCLAIWTAGDWAINRLRRYQLHMRDRLKIPMIGQVWSFPSGPLEVIDVYEDTGKIFCRWTEDGRRVGAHLSRDTWRSYVDGSRGFILERP